MTKKERMEQMAKEAEHHLKVKEILDMAKAGFDSRDKRIADLELEVAGQAKTQV